MILIFIFPGRWFPWVESGLLLRLLSCVHGLKGKRILPPCLLVPSRTQCHHCIVHAPPPLRFSSSPLTSLAHPSTAHHILPGHHRQLIVIFKVRQSKRDDFVIIVVVGSCTHPNNAFHCVFANSYKKTANGNRHAMLKVIQHGVTIAKY